MVSIFPQCFQLMWEPMAGLPAAAAVRHKITNRDWEVTVAEEMEPLLVPDK
jgi:hypothetical protein